MVDGLIVDARIDPQASAPRCGDYLACRVTIRNAVDKPLKLPADLRLAYHWRKDQEVVIWDGLRTPLPRRTDGQRHLTLRPRVATPPEPGQYELEFALVGEDRGWIDSFARGSQSLLDVPVGPATGPTPHLPLNVPEARRLFKNGYLRPVALACETINVCNQACVFCAYPRQQRAKGVMPINVFTRVLERYAEIGGGPLSLTTVGEVLLDVLLPRRLEILSEFPVIHPVSLTSNATVAARLKDAELEAIIPRLDVLQVSIYGLDAAENLAITGGPHYSQMVAGLRKILALAQSRVILAFRTSAPPGAVTDWIGRNLDLSSARAAVEVHGPLRRFGNFATLERAGAPFAGASWRANPTHKVQCIYPLAAVRVFWNGDISFCPCADHEGAPELHLGNISNTSFAEALQSPRCAELWNWMAHGVPELCRRCTHYVSLDDALAIDNFFTDASTTIGA